MILLTLKQLKIFTISNNNQTSALLVCKQCDCLREKKVKNILKNGLTPEQLYDRLLEYSFQYNPTLSLKMIEQML